MSVSIFKQLKAKDTHPITMHPHPLIGGWSADFFFNKPAGTLYVLVQRNVDDTLVAIIPVDYLDEVNDVESDFDPYNDADYADAKLELAHRAMRNASMWQKEGRKPVNGGRCYNTNSLCVSNECWCEG